MPERTKLVGANFPLEQAELIKSVANRRGEGIASFIRKAVYEKLARLRLLDSEQERALGLPGTADE